MNNEYSIVDMLLDPDNESPITLLGEKGEEIIFDQIAVIPYKEKLYAILKPVTKLNGVGSDEAFVFELDVEEDTLNIIYDFDLCDKIFDVYYDLLEKQGF